MRILVFATLTIALLGSRGPLGSPHPLNAAAPVHAVAAQSETSEVSILVYHRFGAAVEDAMTIRTSTFRWQLDYLKQHGHPVIPLRSLIDYRLGRGSAPPPRSVVITADDGHLSVFTQMLPVAREYQAPVTLFVYPSAISNAAYAMTWAQLCATRRDALFDIQSHTYWHPNFNTEKRRLTPDAYREFALTQMMKPRSALNERLGVEADLLAWPFGIYDDELIAFAREAGYVAGFTLERRTVTSGERIMALPRFLVTDRATGRAFASMLPKERR